MKTITFSLDVKSFFLGVITLGGLLLLFNFKPASSPQLQPGNEVGRYQTAVGERGAIILDTKTGVYVYDKGYLGKSRWEKGDFDSSQRQ